MNVDFAQRCSILFNLALSKICVNQYNLCSLCANL